MSEDLQLFCEDMDEQLGIMENALLDIVDMDVEDVDVEQINQIFRAMHTMKGNASMFGYDDVVSFAHVAENLLDEIRSDKISLTSEMVELFLSVNDHSRVLIDHTVNEQPLSVEQLKNHNEIMEQLLLFLNQDNHHTTNEDEPEEESFERYDIQVKLKEEFFVSGMDMFSIIKYLNVIGTIEKISIIEDDIPLLENIEPLKAYLTIYIIYDTSEPLEEIQEAFEFVQEDIELTIKPFEKEQKRQPIKEIQTNDAPKPKTDEPSTPTQKQSNGTKSQSLRVDSTKVDRLINQISEMVIANAKIIEYTQDKEDTELQEAVTIMSEMLEEVRNGIMNIKMVQVGDSFSKLRRIVNDTAKKLGKEISFDIIGADTELDKTVIEKISDPLVHMLRNSVDHGIEMPSKRQEANKDPRGSITLKAYPDAGDIIIEIIDDGAGINSEIIFKKAVEKGVVEASAKLSQKEILDLIFAPGFSTATEVSDVSGRGVGMDVVRRNIEELRGSVEIQSKLGFGTTFVIRLPLTLAIIDGFLVQVGDTKYIIPLDAIQECIELTPYQKNNMRGNGYITLRSQVLPLLDVASHFGLEKQKGKRENIVVVKNAQSTIGLQVDELYGEFQTVIKPLGDLFENIAGISGGTILGSGEIALIFDIPKLIESKIKS
jgi:two-component system chemotaxis sensor kinase CheA